MLGVPGDVSNQLQRIADRAFTGGVSTQWTISLLQSMIEMGSTALLFMPSNRPSGQVEGMDGNEELTGSTPAQITRGYPAVCN